MGAIALLGLVAAAGCAGVPFLGSDPAAPRDRAARFDRFADEVLLELADTAPILERISLERMLPPEAALDPSGGVDLAAEERRLEVRERLVRRALARLGDEFAPERFRDPVRAETARVLRRDLQRLADLAADGKPLGEGSDGLRPPVLSPWSGAPFAAPSVFAREQASRTEADLTEWTRRVLDVAVLLRDRVGPDAPLARWADATSPARSAPVVAAMLDDLSRLRPALGTAGSTDALFGPLAAAIREVREATGEDPRRVRFARAELRTIGAAFDGLEARLNELQREIASEVTAPTVAPLDGAERRRWLAVLRDAAGSDADPTALIEIARAELRRVTDEMATALEVDPRDQVAVRGLFERLRAEAQRFGGEDDATRAPEDVWDEVRGALDRLVAAPHPMAPMVAVVAEPFERPRGRWAPFVAGDLRRADDPLARAPIHLTARPRDTLANRITAEAEALRYGLPGRGLVDAFRRAATGRPRVVRAFAHEGFEEGWALYAAAEALRVGAYEPADDGVGVRVQEAFALGALLVDLGLHGRGWSTEQAVDTLLELTPMSVLEAREAVLRAIAHPGRSALPAIGMLRIRVLRAGVEELLGDDFSAPGFHAALLRGGPVPLGEIDARNERWLAAREPGEGGE